MSKLTREQFKALKRERLLVASLVDEINYKCELELAFNVSPHGFVHVFSFIDSVPQFKEGEYTFSREHLMTVEQLKAVQKELETILNTGEFPND